MSKKITIGKCKDCKYFELAKGWRAYKDGYGYCNSPHWVYVYDEDIKINKVGYDAVLTLDGEGYYADVRVGPDFGCIHFEPKNPENKEE